jgi:cystathionine beta-lyase
LFQLLDYLRGNRDLVFNTINHIKGLHMGPVEATYLAWIDTRDRGLEQPGAFFEQAGVGLSDGSEFGAPGFVRLNFGCPRDSLAEALRRIENSLLNYNK